MHAILFTQATNFILILKKKLQFPKKKKQQIPSIYT